MSSKPHQEQQAVDQGRQQHSDRAAAGQPAVPTEGLPAADDPNAATIEHDYHLFHGTELLAEAHVQLCCVDRDGNPQRWPDWMTIEKPA